MYTLWKCDNGTFDIVDTSDCDVLLPSVVAQNVSAEALADAYMAQLRMVAKPIASAPMDGTVILSDVGCVMYVDQAQWGSPKKRGWRYCDSRGDIFNCADNGDYSAEPKVWAHLPAFMK